ncbi:LysE family translocator [Ralstonia solanacearum]|uniref:LysE family translocator n=3 Tax=Ralstonia solanacearum species complex TaxID=3116862 RepID=A0A454TNG3_9RALS|nr:LysE family translocator [Ralstonia pseudosolanacearum]APC67355.1 LysE family translocator [Ralstonia solanacearum OE1-1]AUS43470.1 LysE family translocator [Ralstonia solanacearum]API76075.1 lysine transporter LysE [Ralstonia pseudosolanacearum]AYA47856.1 LysE family translocator [Ralstonia pseudosolanacearum]MCK4134091.1 LysE family translocator [Ralstonia pseudosolanacearum]
MPLHTWLAFIGASLIVLLIPGPTILLVIGDSLANRGRSAWSTVAGVAAGDTTAMAVSLAGAGALLAASAAAFTVLKLVGGSYLVYLGIRSILTARRLRDDAPEAVIPMQPKSARRRFLSAWTVTALNPKSIVFFVAFVPQFISADQTFVLQGAILLPTFVCLAALNASMYALAARLLARRLTSVAAQRRFGYTGGAVLLGAGTITLGMQSG